MGEELIDFATARLARTLGFRENVVYYFVNDADFHAPDQANEEGSIKDGVGDMNDPGLLQPGVTLYSRPTQDLLQRWLREQGGLEIGLPLGLSTRNSQLAYGIQLWGVDNENQQLELLFELPIMIQGYESAREQALCFALGELEKKRATFV